MSDIITPQSQLFTLPFNYLKTQGFIHPTTRRSLTSEEMRLIKRRLFQKMSLADLMLDGKKQQHTQTPTQIAPEISAEDNVQHVILVTSSKPAEGKSFTALNLALSIVMDEKYNVLLIDADIARATISRHLSLEKEAGLTDLLRDKQPNISDFIKREEHYNLSFIPAGSGVATATDLFGGKKMRGFIQDIAHRYKDRIIIFDAPPLLASTEAVVLAQHVGQVLYVIDGSETPRSTVEAGLDILGRYDNVGLVLNKTTQQSDTAQFGSYYNYYMNLEK